MRLSHWAIILGAVCAEVCDAQGLKAGVSRVDITPAPGFEMWGAAGRKGFAESTLDPLFARTLALKSSEISVALVTLDLGRTFSSEQMERLRTRVAQSVGVRHVIFTASHTHTGPNMMDDKYLQEAGERWEAKALEQIAQC